MCGIAACFGGMDACSAVIQGLKQLEYRGYDSWGIAAVHGKKVAVEKRVGRISSAKALAGREASKAAIGHTRWATHGKVTKANAHPHLDCTASIAVVHNGIIENYAELKQQLLERGHVFRSETDSEVIAHLVEEEKKQCKDFQAAASTAMRRLQGSFAVAILDADSGAVAGARKNSPLVVGLGKGNGFFLASDVTAFLQHTKKAVFLDDNEAVFLGNGKPVFSNFFLGKRIEKKPVSIAWSAQQAEKKGFKHFMLKEIAEQPEKVAAAMGKRLMAESIDLPELRAVLDKAAEFDKVVLLGCGTAYHACLVAEYLFEQLCRLPARAEYASEFRYRQPVIGEKTLAIAVSQSGETADTLAAVKEAKAAGATVVSVLNAEGSSIARESNYVLYINAGPEIGVASTKAFTCMLVSLAEFAACFAGRLGSISDKQLAELTKEFKRLPALVESALQQGKEVEAIAKRYFEKKNALFLGRGVNYPIALEGALKLKEISYVHAEAMPAAEMKHGPIALIDEEMPVVFIAVNDKSYDKILGNIEEVKARGGKVIAVANNGDSKLKSKADEIIFVPRTSELLQPILNVVPLQLFAYRVAELRGCDIDKPRNLAKSVTVE